MIGPVLVDGNLRLVEPNVDRDAPLGVTWLNGSGGHETMRLMGNAPIQIKDTFLDEQRELVQRFIDQEDEINWMIEIDGQVVGSIWIHLADTDHISAPTLSIMIGDSAARRKGISLRAAKLVLEWAKDQFEGPMHMRALTDNEPSQALIKTLGAAADSPTYKDVDGLEWQNFSL